ncbi:CPBP family intramembrane glutamic endopeptidase [Halobaculum lipolyticum]|uniref:CPBP family intramembrane glutamic endopeptidase n=1 Tax=Halobaculum lipolyticum TaxID=3032001 RepID=A0ABD5W787_9EURY|nr:CPBP family intramembrane glutamic endopeptidase [Halobaculum sp. DT31]
MTRWTAFVGVSTVVLGLLLGLARLSAAQFTAPEPTASTAGDAEAAGGPEDTGRAATAPYHPAADHDPALTRPERTPVADAEAEAELTAGALLANVALSQGTFGALLVAAAVWAGVPAEPLGLVPLATVTDLAAGVGLGVALWLASEAGGRLAPRWGVEVNEELRGALAPRSAAGWAVLLLAVLPTVALFEEFLFRAVLVGAFSAAAPALGVAVSPWLLAALSSVAFALGHGAQGRAGVVATGALGFVLAAAFLLAGSFAVVAVAHYLVNALTLVVHEGLGADA